jgi:hypothetical protein
MLFDSSVPLLARPAFVRRSLSHFKAGGVLLLGALNIGILGYHFIARLTWIDALLNASMILTGMGPVNTLNTVPAKLFASGYALFSGVFFLAASSVVLAPLLHRLLHHLHIEDSRHKVDRT